MDVRDLWPECAVSLKVIQIYLHRIGAVAGKIFFTNGQLISGQVTAYIPFIQIKKSLGKNSVSHLVRTRAC